MRKLLLIALGGIFCFSAEAQLKVPAPSPTQTIKQDFALSSIEVSYSRPGMKGRKIYGDLVPFGKVWRTGANNATTITFGEDVTIGGKKVTAGKYGLVYFLRIGGLGKVGICAHFHHLGDHFLIVVHGQYNDLNITVLFA